MKIEVEDDPKIVVDKLFGLYVEHLQEENNFKNKISNEFVRKNTEMHGKDVYQFKWLYEYALSINQTYTKQKVKEIVIEILMYYQKEHERCLKNHSHEGRKAVYVMPKWDYLYKQYLEVKELFE